jgi:hypothetical protein
MRSGAATPATDLREIPPQDEAGYRQEKEATFSKEKVTATSVQKVERRSNEQTK